LSSELDTSSLSMEVMVYIYIIGMYNEFLYDLYIVLYF